MTLKKVGQAVVLVGAVGFAWFGDDLLAALPEEWSPSDEQWLPLYLAGSACVALVYFWKKKQTTHELASTAASLGMTFEVTPSHGFPPFPSLRHGAAPHHVAVRRFGEHETAVFEFGGGTDEGPSQTGAAHRLPGHVVPAFTMWPESIVDDLVSAFGGQDIEFPDHPAFNGNYVLKGTDEAAVRAFFRLEVVQLFATEPGWCVEGCDDWILLYRVNVRESPREVPGFLRETTRIADTFSQRRQHERPPG